MRAYSQQVTFVERQAQECLDVSGVLPLGSDAHRPSAEKGPLEFVHIPSK
jgi:hypothetical protein